jgi:hypothetical protein
MNGWCVVRGSAHHPPLLSASLSAVTAPASTRLHQPRTVRRSVRAGLRAAIVVFAAVVVLLPALPAAAASDVGNIGNVRDPQGLSVPMELLLFIGIPLLGFLVAALLSFRPSKGSRGRYRPGRPWTYEPVWFGDESALEYEPKRAALPGAGGASGRW